MCVGMYVCLKAMSSQTNISNKNLIFYFYLTWTLFRTYDFIYSQQLDFRVSEIIISLHTLPSAFSGYNLVAWSCVCCH